MVSIIIPVYNVAPFLRKCLDSCLSQTYKNIEIITINDGSTDDSGKILDEYGLKDSRIKVFHQLNKGVSATRNRGIKEAKGTWCCFIDSDDYVDPNYIEKFVNSISDNNYFYINRGYIINYDNKKEFYKGIPTNYRIDNMELLYMWGEQYYTINSPWLKLFSLDIIRKNNIKFDINLSFGEDHLFVLDYILVLPVFQGYIIENNGYRYLKSLNHRTLTTKLPPYEKMCKYAINAYEKRMEIINQNNINNPAFLDFIKSDCKKYLIFALVSLINSSEFNYNRKMQELRKIRNSYINKFKGIKLQSKYYSILSYLVDYKSDKTIYISLPLFYNFLHLASHIKNILNRI